MEKTTVKNESADKDMSEAKTLMSTCLTKSASA